MKERIHQSQLWDSELQSKVDQPCFTRAKDETFLFSQRIYIPSDADLKRIFLEETHKSGFTIHHGSSKMYQDLRKDYWWP